MMAVTSAATLRGRLSLNEPMARHTSWRVGGPADRFYQPADVADLAAFLAGMAPDEPVFWLGLGSNLLVRDGGIRGTVIATSGVIGDLQHLSGNRVRVGAGVACAKGARFSARAGLCNAEFLAGIPGTMGGALAMNAGAFGGETWNIVVAVDSISRDGVIHRRTPADYQVGYRSVRGPVAEWFIAAELQLVSCDSEAAQARIKELLARRGATQPTQQPNAGSVFRNPEGGHAARLIQECGLKGFCIGGACVSEKHANFIVNTGDATAADIETLIAHVAATVLQHHGVALAREVHIVGETP